MAAGGRVIEAFQQGMRDLGWLEGGNVEYRFVFAGGDMIRLDELASQLIAQQVDVIVVTTTSAAFAAQRATKTIPIVLLVVPNVVAAGLVASLAKPGGNVTGLSSQGEEVLGKLIEILHAAAPRARRIAILLSGIDQPRGVTWATAQSACAALGLVALRAEASTPTQLSTAVEQIVRQRAEAVVVTPHPLYFNERAKLQELMQTTGLPVAYPFRGRERLPHLPFAATPR